jgi:hypothetical protein
VSRIIMCKGNALLSVDPGHLGAQDDLICAPWLVTAEEPPVVQIGGTVPLAWVEANHGT